VKQDVAVGGDQGPAWVRHFVLRCDGSHESSKTYLFLGALLLTAGPEISRGSRIGFGYGDEGQGSRGQGEGAYGAASDKLAGG
jgi:hypothetical protein